LPLNAIPALLLRILRYGCVGVAISLLYSFAVIAAVHVLRPIGPTMASVLAFGIVQPLAWVSHRSISFGDRPRDAFQPLRFALTTTASFVVAVGGMYWITEIAGRSYLLGIAWNWMIIPAMNFGIYLVWVFRSKQNGRQMA
jgi:putative flippase GtrA